MKKIKVTSGLKIILGAIQISILFLPVHFLNEILSLKTDLVFIPMYAVPLLCGVASFIAVYSETVRASVLKFILSVPITVLFWRVQIEMQFSIRALNWVLPGYGKPSAGGNFASFILLCSLAFFVFVGVIFGIIFSREKLTERKQKILFLIQNSVVSFICIGIAAGIAILNNIMPEYHYVYG